MASDHVTVVPETDANIIVDDKAATIKFPLLET